MNKYEPTYRKWTMLLNRVADSRFGVQLKPEEALELSKLITEMACKIGELKVQLDQAMMEQLRTPVCEKCALGGGKHEE